MNQKTQQPSFVATHPWNDDKSKAILIDALRNPEENLKESISLEEHAQIGQILRSMQDQYVLSAVGYLARSVVADKVTHPEFNQMTDTAIKVSKLVLLWRTGRFLLSHPKSCQEKWPRLTSRSIPVP